MSRLTELIARVARSDPALAADLRREVDVLSGRRQFGLNFERHVPESVQLPNRRPRQSAAQAARSAMNNEVHSSSPRRLVDTLTSRPDRRIHVATCCSTVLPLCCRVARCSCVREQQNQ